MRITDIKRSHDYLERFLADQRPDLLLEKNKLNTAASAEKDMMTSGKDQLDQELNGKKQSILRFE